jgi:phosphatidate cytidylyltransferase
VSDRGDDQGDDRQPADPWEIGSGPADVADPRREAAADPGRGSPRRRRRRGRGAAKDEGRPQDDETQVVDPVVQADDAPSPAGPPAAEDRGRSDDADRSPPDASDGSDDWSALMAERSPYGVSTPEAFAALADEEHEGFDDWESFVAESASDRLPDPFESGEIVAPAPMSRRERRRARKAARRAANEVAADDGGEPDDAIPAWVEGGPEETAWLDVPDDDEASDDDLHGEAWADEPPTPDEPVGPAEADGDGDGEPMAERGDTAGERATPGAAAAVGEGWGPSADDGEDEAVNDFEPPDEAFSPAPEGEDVWLASEQPLVHEEEFSTGRHPIEPAGETQQPAGEEAAWSGDETAEDGYDDTDADEWVTGAVGYGADAASAEPSALAPPDPGDVAITEDIYSQSVTVEHLGLAEEIFRAGEDEELEWQAVSAAMPGLGTGVVGFEDVADLEADQEEYVERAPSDLGTRIGTGVILVGLLIGALWVGAEAFAAFVGLLVLIALGEFYTALRLRRFRPIALFGYLGGIGVLVGTWYHGPMAIAVAIAITTVVTFFVYAFTPLGRDALTNGGLTVLGVVWVTGAAAFALPLVQADEFRVLVITVVAVTVAMDVGAFGVGRMWGSRALAPVLSPNKTLEGLFGGIAVTIAAALGAAALFEGITTSFALWLAAIVIVLAPVGDLAESMVKRSLQLKDMGTILPGHGGVLDRIDAFLFILPGAWALSKVLGLIG